MNYIELGLPHAAMIPLKTASPRPLLPVSGLSRKYLGIESMTKSEMGSLVDRLSKPKRSVENQDPNHVIQPEAAPEVTKKRFVGRKRMTNRDISSMVDRLSRGSSNRTSDTQRVQQKEVQRQRGITASYAWQGCHKYPAAKWASPAIMTVK